MYCTCIAHVYMYMYVLFYYYYLVNYWVESFCSCHGVHYGYKEWEGIVYVKTDTGYFKDNLRNEGKIKGMDREIKR